MQYCPMPADVSWLWLLPSSRGFNSKSCALNTSNLLCVGPLALVPAEKPLEKVSGVTGNLSSAVCVYVCVHEI